MRPRLQARRLLQYQLDDWPRSSGWSADGSHFAVATAGGRISLLALAAGAAPQQWQAHAGPVQCLRWHPQAKLLSSAGEDGRVRHWQLAATPSLQADHKVADTWIEDMAWRPDGRWLAVAAGHEAFILAADGSCANTLEFAASTIAALAWNPRGTVLALAGYGGVQLCSGVTGRPQRSTLPWHGSLLGCCWSPDGKVLAACRQDNALHFWRVSSRRDAQMSGYPGKPRALAFTPDARHLVTGGSKSLIVWDFTDGGPEGRPPHELDYHRAQVSSVAIDPLDGYLAAGSKDGVISLWDSTTATHPFWHFALEAAPVALHWSRYDGRRLLAVCTEAGEVGIWDIFIA